jgi:hypothetical protein
MVRLSFDGQRTDFDSQELKPRINYKFAPMPDLPQVPEVARGIL